MGFHRLTVPTYFGGLPGSYDYINNAVTGTPAPADGVKAGGNPNDGTYFIAFGEDATSSNSNRANAALAENCDIIDDTLRGSQVVMRYTDAVLGAPANNVALTGNIYVGGASESPAVVNDQETRNRLVRVVDSSGNDVVVSGVKVVPSLIDDGSFNNQVGVPADGFYTDPTVRFNQALPAGTYRVYYLIRRHLTDIVASKPGEYFAEQIRTAGEGASLYSILRTTDLYLHGMDDLYRRASAYDATPPPAWPGAVPTADTAGNGAWFVKDSYPLMGFATPSGSSFAGSLNAPDYHLGATYAAEINSTFIFSLDTHRSSAGSGFVALGRKRTGLNDPVQGDPGLFGFFHGTRRDSGDSANTNDATVIEAGDVFTLSGDQLTLGGGWFYKNLGGSDRSAFVKMFDIIVMEEDATGDIYYVTVSAFTSDTVATIRYLDGSEPNLSGDFNFVDWIAPMMLSAEDAGAWHFENITGGDPPHFLSGFVYAVPPKVRYTDSLMTFTGWARIFAPTTGRDYAMSWGGYNDLTPTGSLGATFSERGYLFGDGGAEFGGIVSLRAGGSGADTTALLATDVAASNNKLLLDTPGSATGNVRMYYDTTNFTFTQNAEWTGAQWDRDNVAVPSVRYRFSADGVLRVETASAAANPITWSAKANLQNTLVMRDNAQGGAAATSFDNAGSGTRNVQFSSTDISVIPIANAGDTIMAESTFVINPGGNTVNVWLDAYYSATDHAILGTVQQFTGTDDIHVALKGLLSAPGGSVAVHIRFQIVGGAGTTNFIGQYRLATEVTRS